MAALLVSTDPLFWIAVIVSAVVIVGVLLWPGGKK